MIATGGQWDPSDRNCYFLAGDARPTRRGEPHPYVLIAVNEVAGGDGNVTPEAHEGIEHLLSIGTRLLVDSGVFWLTNEHKRKHGITMDEALALPPDRIDGFDWLWRSYTNVHRLYGDRAWGFIELDQGGAENKRKTRAKLHDIGISPMPVYHPLNDGWDYFDELATQYDRICCGNIVQAQGPLRIRLLQTIAERHRAYPDLWIHFLGFTPNQWVNAIPVDSCDSSTWLSGLRWGQLSDQCMSRSFGDLPPELIYARGVDENTVDPESQYGQCSEVAAVMASFQQRAWRHWRAALRAGIGMADYPEPDEVAS